MELWIPITIAAAFLQNFRSALQKHLKGELSTTGATFVRFGFGFPLAICYVLFLHYGLGHAWPTVSWEFAAYGIGGGLAQISATYLLVHLFSYRNFAVGTAYSKTEPVQAAIFGLIFLGDMVSTGAVIAIMIGIVGVILISLADTQITLGSLLRSLVGRVALLGILSGAMFGFSAVFYRGASLALGGPDGPGFLMQAGFALACVTVFQTLVMASYMAAREPGQFPAMVRKWRACTMVGIAGVLGSMGWFTAMTIENVAYVRALAQIELIFTFGASILFFREKVTGRESIGATLIAIGIVVLLLWR